MSFLPSMPVCVFVTFLFFTVQRFRPGYRPKLPFHICRDICLCQIHSHLLKALVWFSWVVAPAGGRRRCRKYSVLSTAHQRCVGCMTQSSLSSHAVNSQKSELLISLNWTLHGPCTRGPGSVMSCTVPTDNVQISSGLQWKQLRRIKQDFKDIPQADLIWWI